MAYTPINWQDGETITAEKLNKMDPGWDIAGSTRTLLFQETVTTVGEGPAFAALAYSGTLDAPFIVVTLNGTEYECQYDSDIPGYGDIEYTTYPFVLDQYEGENELCTPVAGTFTVKVETLSQAAVEVSQDFTNAIALHATLGATTFQEVSDALAAGRFVVVFDGGSMNLVCAIDGTTSPREVYAVSVNSSGPINATYYAASDSAPIAYRF